MRFVKPVALTLLFAACGAPQDDSTPVVNATPSADATPIETHEDAFTSNQATLLNFEFDMAFTGSSWSNQQTAQDQLLYTIGQLNGNRSVGRLDKVELTNFKVETQADGSKLTKYHVKLPVAWASKTNLPTTYEFKLPKQADSAGFDAFTTKYKDKCIDWSAHDVDVGSMWYYYRPAQCTLDAADIVTASATISTSTENTTGKYPEFHKVWEDNSLRIVAVFGKNEEGATDNSDAGIAAYNEAAAFVQNTWAGVTSSPANVGLNPGVAHPDIEFNFTKNGRSLRINLLLVDKVSTAPVTFDTRYAQLTDRADLIGYYGHAGLGQNVRALVRKGKFVAGQYQIVFMNGCDTFAYVDGYMAQVKMALNPDDTKGTKYLDFITNAMPSYFHNNADNMMYLTKALFNPDAPKTYDQIFTSVDTAQVVLATGEEDNVYYPGYNPNQPPPSGWTGLDAKDEVAKAEVKSYVTPDLPAGKYTFNLSHDTARPGGDADLYVRVGSAPTTATYTCRPYTSGSIEECQITLTATSKVYIQVIGYASAQKSAYVLTGRGATTPTGPAPWAGHTFTGAVTKGQEWRFETPLVPAGRYEFTIAQAAGTTGGDADLYVRSGSAPSLTQYECRPYANGSAETCAVQLAAPGKIFVMVQGYATASSGFTFTGAQR